MPQSRAGLRSATTSTTPTKRLDEINDIISGHLDVTAEISLAKLSRLGMSKRSPSGSSYAGPRSSPAAAPRYPFEGNHGALHHSGQFDGNSAHNSNANGSVGATDGRDLARRHAVEGQKSHSSAQVAAAARNQSASFANPAPSPGWFPNDSSPAPRVTTEPRDAQNHTASENSPQTLSQQRWRHQMHFDPHNHPLRNHGNNFGDVHSLYPEQREAARSPVLSPASQLLQPNSLNSHQDPPGDWSPSYHIHNRPRQHHRQWQHPNQPQPHQQHSGQNDQHHTPGHPTPTDNRARLHHAQPSSSPPPPPPLQQHEQPSRRDFSAPNAWQPATAPSHHLLTPFFPSHPAAVEVPNGGAASTAQQRHSAPTHATLWGHSPHHLTSSSTTEPPVQYGFSPEAVVPLGMVPNRANHRVMPVGELQHAQGNGDTHSFVLRYHDGSIGLTLAGPAFATQACPRPVIKVRAVKPNSQAATLGVRPGDVVVAINGTSCEGEGRTVVIGKIKDTLSQQGQIVIRVRRARGKQMLEENSSAAHRRSDAAVLPRPQEHRVHAPPTRDDGPDGSEEIDSAHMGPPPPPTQENLTPLEKFWYFSLFNRLANFEEHTNLSVNEKKNRGSSHASTLQPTVQSATVWKLLRRAAKRTPSPKFRGQGILLKISEKSKRSVADLVMDPLVALRCFSEGCRAQRAAVPSTERADFSGTGSVSANVQFSDELPRRVTWAAFAAIMRLVAFVQTGIYTTGLDWLTLENVREISSWPTEAGGGSGGGARHILPLAYFISKSSRGSASSMHEMISAPPSASSSSLASSQDLARPQLKDISPPGVRLSGLAGAEFDDLAAAHRRAAELRAAREANGPTAQPESIVWCVVNIGAPAGFQLVARGANTVSASLPTAMSGFVVESVAHDSAVYARGVRPGDELLSVGGVPVGEIQGGVSACERQIRDERRERLLLFRCPNREIASTSHAIDGGQASVHSAHRLSAHFDADDVVGIYVEGGVEEAPDFAPRAGPGPGPGPGGASWPRSNFFREAGDGAQRRYFSAIRVSGFTRDSAAPQQGVEVGDEILSINGVSVENASLEFTKKLLRQVADTARVMEFLRRGEGSAAPSSDASDSEGAAHTLSLIVPGGKDAGFKLVGGTEQSDSVLRHLGTRSGHAENVFSPLSVDKIAPGSFAELAGVRCRDVLEGVNDVDVRGMSFGFVHQLLKRMKPVKRTICFRRHLAAKADATRFQAARAERELDQIIVAHPAGEHLGLYVKGGVLRAGGAGHNASPLMVSEFMSQSRALKAGVKIGDFLTSVNGVTVEGKTLEFCRSLLSSAKNQERRLTFRPRLGLLNQAGNETLPQLHNLMRSPLHDFDDRHRGHNGLQRRLSSQGIDGDGHGDPGPQSRGGSLLRAVEPSRDVRRTLHTQSLRAASIGNRIPRSGNLKLVSVAVEPSKKLGVDVEGGDALANGAFSPIVVTGFGPRSAIFDHGIRVGDQLVAVNGEAVENKSLHFCLRLIARLRNSRRELTFRRGSFRYKDGVGSATERPATTDRIAVAAVVAGGQSVGVYVEGGDPSAGVGDHDNVQPGMFSPIIASGFSGSSSVQEQGVCVGDELVAVNGVSMRGKSMEYCVRVLGKMKTQRRVLAFERPSVVSARGCARASVSNHAGVQGQLSTMYDDTMADPAAAAARPYSGDSEDDDTASTDSIATASTEPVEGHNNPNVGRCVTGVVEGSCPIGVFVEGGEPLSGSSGSFSPIVASGFNKGSTIEAQGVRVGDQLVAVNGVSMRGKSMEYCVRVLGKLKKQRRLLAFQASSAELRGGRRPAGHAAVSRLLSQDVPASGANDNDSDTVRVVIDGGQTIGMFVTGGESAKDSPLLYSPIEASNFAENSPAKAQGAAEGDVLLSVNGVAVEGKSMEYCVRLLGKLKDEQRELVLRHNSSRAAVSSHSLPQRRLSGTAVPSNELHELAVVIGPHKQLGVYVEGGESCTGAANDETNREFSPLVVNSFQPSSPALQQGVEKGDILMSVNGERVDNKPLAHCLKLLTQLKDQERLLLLHRPSSSSDSEAVARQLHEDFENSAAESTGPRGLPNTRHSHTEPAAPGHQDAATSLKRRDSRAVMSEDSDDEYRQATSGAVPVILMEVRSRGGESTGVSLNYRLDDERELRVLGRIFVDGVTANSPAAREGVRVNDTLVSVGKHDMRNATLDDLNDVLADLPPGKPKILRFERMARSAADAEAHRQAAAMRDKVGAPCGVVRT